MEVIRVENLSKLYDLGQVSTGTISKDLNRWWASVRGKEDPYARIGQVNDRARKAGDTESVWALKDINFSVNQGEIVGIIARELAQQVYRLSTPGSFAKDFKLRSMVNELYLEGKLQHFSVAFKTELSIRSGLLFKFLGIPSPLCFLMNWRNHRDSAYEQAHAD